MPSRALHQLHQRTIAVELTVDQTARVVKGLGLYEPNHELGPLLRILVDEPAGQFELLVKERDWTGQVLPGEARGCDYAIKLEASSYCSK